MLALKASVVILTQIFFIHGVNCGVELEFFDDIESISVCALKVAERHFGGAPNLNIFSINSSRDYDLLSKFYASPNFGKKLKNFVTFKVDFYETFRRYTVIAAQNLNEIIRNKDQIKKLLLWNARSWYIFVVRTNSIVDIDQALELLWYNYIINAVILMPSAEKHHNIEIYSWFPFENGLCGQDFKAQLVDTCVHGQFEKNVDLYPEKVPLILNGCPVRAKVIIAPPYVMPPDDGIVKDDEVLNITDGIEIRLMITISELLNFTFLPMSSTIPNDWGLATPDGETSGTIKVLYEKRAELGFGSYGPTAERRMYCDYSASHTFESVTWCVPKSQLAPRWRNILDTFQYSTWLSMIGAYIVVSCITWCFCYTLPKDLSSYVMLKNCFKYLFSIFLAVSANETPKKVSSRIMFFVWIVFGLHFVAAYQAKLISVLLHPTYERQMDSLDEILTSGIEWASLPTLKRFYNNTDDWRVAKINNEWNTQQSAIKGLTRIAKKRDYAFCILENNARYEILRFVGKDAQPLIYCLPSYLTYASEIYMTKGFPLKDRIDKQIYRIKATGLMAKWQEDASYELKLKNRNKMTSDEDSTQKLTVDHLQGAFMVLGLGLSCALLAFIGEMIYFLIKKKTMRKKVVNQWKHYTNNSAKTRGAIKSIRVVQNYLLPETSTSKQNIKVAGIQN